MLAAHDAGNTNFDRAHGKLGSQVNRMYYNRYVTSLDGLPIYVRPLEEVGTFGDNETLECAKAR